MAEGKSAAKRHRQNEKRRLRNRAIRSRVKTCQRGLLESISAKSKDEAQQQYQEFSGLVDRAVTKGVFHRNTAARKKSRMNRLLGKLG